jgi:hypothetical protein
VAGWESKGQERFPPNSPQTWRPGQGYWDRLIIGPAPPPTPPTIGISFRARGALATTRIGDCPGDYLYIENSLGQIEKLPISPLRARDKPVIATFLALWVQ